MAKSIKKLAEEVGVSKTAIRKKIENLGLRERLHQNGNQFLVDEETEMLIKTAFEKKKETETRTKTETETRTKTETENRVVSDIFDVFKTELEEKNKQIAELQQQLTKAQELLAEAHKVADQAQQLHASDKMEIQKLKEELKALEDKNVKKCDVEQETVVEDIELSSKVISTANVEKDERFGWFKRIFKM